MRVNKSENFDQTVSIRRTRIPTYENINRVYGLLGDIGIDRESDQLCFHDGLKWVCLSDSNPEVLESNTIYVDNTITQVYTPNGSILFPYRTINDAINDVLSRSPPPGPTNRFEIKIAQGIYSEDLTIPPSTVISGVGHQFPLITSDTVTLDASFSGNIDHRSSLKDLNIFSNTIDLDFFGLASFDGKLDIESCRLTAEIRVNSDSLSNQINVYDSDIFGNWTQIGGNLSFQGTQTVNVQTLTLIENINVPQESFFSPSHSFVYVLDIDNSQFGRTIRIFTSNFSFIFGDWSNADSNVDYFVLTGFPLVSRVSGFNNVTYRRDSDIFQFQYDPAIPANWNTVPNNAKDALDELAQRIKDLESP